MADLNVQARSLWAKARNDPGGQDLWLPLLEHLDDAVVVAEYLWKNWLAGTVKRRLMAEVGSEESALKLYQFLAGVHDIGKATPAFASAAGVPVLLRDRIRKSGLDLADNIVDRSKLHHGLAGHILLSRYLVTKRISQMVADEIAVIVGGHHGIPPTTTSVYRGGHDPRLIGDVKWSNIQNFILERMVETTSVRDLLRDLSADGLSQPAQVLFSGLVILADWLASNVEFFPLLASTCESLDRQSRNEFAIQGISFPASWSPKHPTGSVGSRLRNRFGMPTGVEPYPVQSAAVEAARRLDGLGIMVIEAPMGEGKTEASLLAAEVLAADAAASGLFFALPTQATSDAIFERLLNWLARMPADLNSTVHTVALLHGRAGLSKAWGELPLSRGVEGVGVDDDAQSETFIQSYVDPWTRGSKRAVLADFGVGTVDQLLFLALKTRHLVLRHLGVASKIVVIDEVHSYDAYMDTYLLRALEWLGSYGVPVILLSATLTETLRRSLIGAYLGTTTTGGPETTKPLSGDKSAYPLIVCATRTEEIAIPIEPSNRRFRVEVQHLDPKEDELNSVCDLLSELLREGGCALVVRNTVARAIEMAKAIKARLPFEVRLLHSRFTSNDRLRKEVELRRDFGVGRSAMKGKPVIVVSTQVVEQSLDVDFDVLVSDVAPLDLLLQRVGRIHRHSGSLPSEMRCSVLRQPKVWLTGMVDWSAVPPSAVKGSESVYGLYPLLRSLAVLGLPDAGSTIIRVPEDVRSLIEQAYGDEDVGPTSWANGLSEARKTLLDRRASAEERARTFRVSSPSPKSRPLLGWLDGAVDDSEGSTAGQRQVRDSEASVEVIVLRDDGRGAYRSPSSSHGQYRFDWNEMPSEDEVRLLIGCTVRLPEWVVEGSRGDALIDEMEQRWYPAVWQNSPMLRGRLMMVLDEDGRQQCSGLNFSYDSEYGFEVSRD